MKDGIRDDGFECIGSQEDSGLSSHGKTSSTGKPDPSLLRSLSIFALRKVFALGIEKLGTVTGNDGNAGVKFECRVIVDCILSSSVLSSDMSLRSDIDTESFGLVNQVRFDGTRVRPDGCLVVLYPERDGEFHFLNG